MLSKTVEFFANYRLFRPLRFGSER